MLLLEDKLSKIIELISIPQEFGCYEEDNYCGVIEDWEYILQNKVSEDIYVASGVSKCAIVLPSNQYVIKIPFTGRYYPVYDEDGDYVDDSFEEFSYANSDINDDAECWDYCENELLKYEKAVEDGFGDFFAETKFYTYKKYHPIYIQERIKDYYTHDTPTNDSTEKYNSLKNKSELPSEWVKLAIDWYGFERVKELITYLHDNCFSDFHCGNVGFRTNGAPVILDFSGWRD